MESLKISTGQISLNILDDYGNSRGIFSFNPEDVRAAKVIFALMDDLKEKQIEFDAKAEQSQTEQEKIEFLNEVVDYFESAIDQAFGEGSSLILFGNAKTLSMFDGFFNGIMPYYQKASENRMSKYIGKSGN